MAGLHAHCVSWLLVPLSHLILLVRASNCIRNAFLFVWILLDILYMQIYLCISDFAFVTFPIRSNYTSVSSSLLKPSSTQMYDFLFYILLFSKILQKLCRTFFEQCVFFEEFFLALISFPKCSLGGVFWFGALIFICVCDFYWYNCVRRVILFPLTHSTFIHTVKLFS